MKNKMKSSKKIIQYLNLISSQDMQTVHAVLSNRIPIQDKSLLNSPDIPVSTNPCRGYSLSGLGVINGLLESLGHKKVAMEYDDETGEFVRFCEYRYPKKEKKKSSKK